MTAPLWYSQRQIAQLLGVKVATISRRIKSEQEEIPFDEHECIQPFTIGNRAYQVRFYDLFALFRITSNMQFGSNKRAFQIFWAGCGWVTAMVWRTGAEDEKLDRLLTVIENIENVPNSEFSRAGFVYLLGNKDGLCKIGMTIDPVTRFRDLEHEHGPLERLALIETDDRRKTERDYHQKFAQKCVRLEWFALSDDDIASIQQDMTVNLDRVTGARLYHIDAGKDGAS